VQIDHPFCFFLFHIYKKGNTNCLRHNFVNIFFSIISGFLFFLLFFLFFIVNAMSYTGAHSNFSQLVLHHRAVGPWSMMTTQFLSSNGTLP